MSSDAFRGWARCVYCKRYYMKVFYDIVEYRYRNLWWCGYCAGEREDPPEAEAQSGSNT